MPQRIADEKRIERQWMILNKITRRNGVTKQQLIAETGVSERTIERDIPILMRYFSSIIEERDGLDKNGTNSRTTTTFQHSIYPT